MSGTGRLCRGSILAVAGCCAFLVAQNLLLGETQKQIDSLLSTSIAAKEESREFEDTIKSLQSENVSERHAAAVSLGKSGNPAAVPPLIGALSDPDYFVRSFAAVALGNLKDARSMDPLIKALKDEHQRVRRSAAEALGSMQNPKALEPLIQTLNNDENVFVRRSAAQALGNLGDPRAVGPLLKALGDEDSYIAAGASLALTAIGKAAVPELTAVLSDRTLGPKAAEILKSLNVPASAE